MIYHLALANLIYFSLVAQPALGALLGEQDYRPWLPGISLVVCVLFGADLPAVIWAFALGLSVDCLSIHRLGGHTMIATFLVAFLRQLMGDDRPRGALWFVVYTFAVTFLWLTLSAMVHGFLEGQTVDVANSCLTAGTMALATTALTAAIIVLCGLIRVSVRAQRRSPVMLNNRWSMLNWN